MNVSNGNSSIIDYLLTDMHVSKIAEHKILPGDLGRSSQTAHKALLTKILLVTIKQHYHRPKKSPKWRAITEKNFLRYCNNLQYELANLTIDRLSFKSLLTAVNRAKTNSLG